MNIASGDEALRGIVRQEGEDFRGLLHVRF